MSQHKWKIGPVKLANGDDAFIDAINEGQEEWMYTGRVRSGRLLIATGWDNTGRRMYSVTGCPTDLAPPPKKKVRVKCWLVVYPNGKTCRYSDEWNAIHETKRNGLALIAIDREVEEGEGL